MGKGKMNNTIYHPVHIGGAFPFRLFNIPNYIEGEHIWSYMARLSLANGFKQPETLFRYLNSKNIQKSWENHKDWGWELENPLFTSIINIEGVENWIKETTLFKALEPFNSPWEQANRIRKHAEEYTLKVNKLLTVTAPYLDSGLRICPECAKEDIENGVFHYHLEHLMPGIAICPKHGCHLYSYDGPRDKAFPPTDDNCLKEAECDDLGKAYASFCKGLIEHPIVTNCNETKMLIYNKIYKRFPFANLISENLDLLFEKDSRLSAYPDVRRFMKDISRGYWDNSNTLPYKETIRTLIILFGTYENFYKEMASTYNMQLEFQEVIEGKYELVSKYSNDIVLVRCLKCGKVFPTAPISLIMGWDCPECNQNIADEEIIHEMFDKVAHEKGWVMPPNCNTSSSRISFHNIITNETRFITFSNLLYQVFMESKPKSKIQQEYEQIKATKNDILHEHLKEEMLAKASLGSFSYERDKDTGMYIASNGEKELKDMNFTALCKRVESYCNFDQNAGARKKIRENIETAIHNHKRIILVDDVCHIPALNAYTRRLLNDACLEGRLNRYANSTYMSITATLSADDITHAKFFENDGRYVGVPICESLLAFMKTGKVVCDNTCFAVYNPASYVGMGMVSRSVGKVNLKVLYIREEVQEETWLKKAIIYTLQCFNYIKDLSDDDKDFLRELCEKAGVTSDDISGYYKKRSPYYVNTVTSLIEGK